LPWTHVQNDIREREKTARESHQGSKVCYPGNERKKEGHEKNPAPATVMPKGSTKRKRNKKAEGKTRRENEECS
jgi:hypothetical protein